MKLEYYPETDTLYIDLLEKSSASSLEISEGVVLDYDEKGRLVGIDIDNNGLISPVDGAISRYEKMRKSKPNYPRMWFINADAGALLNYEDQVKALGSNMSDRNK